MAQTSIDERISVIGIYDQARFQPAKFKWRNQIYPVEATTMIYDLKDGEVRKRRFSILSGGTLYRLCFDREKETWILEEVWSE